jgi:hypothetical protein
MTSHIDGAPIEVEPRHEKSLARQNGDAPGS